MDYILPQSTPPVENPIQYNINNIETFNSCENCVYCDKCNDPEDCDNSNISPDIINYINNQLSSYLKTSDAENLYAKMGDIEDLTADLNNQLSIVNTNFANIQAFLE